MALGMPLYDLDVSHLLSIYLRGTIGFRVAGYVPHSGELLHYESRFLQDHYGLVKGEPRGGVGFGQSNTGFTV